MYNQLPKTTVTAKELNYRFTNEDVIVVNNAITTFTDLVSYLDVVYKKQQYIVFDDYSLTDIITDISKQKIYPCKLDEYLIYKYNLTIKYI